MTLLAITMVATIFFASCKKENQNVKSNNNSAAVSHFDPSHITDMNAYLGEFKQKMKQSQYTKDNEILSLEEAAWHLSSVANYDFANANVEFDDIRFDTIYSTVNITGGSVLLSDMSTAYENISNDIEKFYHKLMLTEKHIRFINVSISNDGKMAVSMITTFMHGSKNLEDTLWAYDDVFDFWLDYYTIYDDLPTLPASTLGKERMVRFLNWKESRPVYPAASLVYYTPTTISTLHFRDEIDPFGSPNFLNSRLFANNGYFNMDISSRFAYLCDSFLGLGHEHCPTGQSVIVWDIIYDTEPPHQGETFWIEFYDLVVQYGVRHELTPSPGGGAV